MVGFSALVKHVNCDIIQNGKRVSAIATSNVQQDKWPESDHGIFLLFASGKRPDRGAIHRFAASHITAKVSYDPQAEPPLEFTEDGSAPQSLTECKPEQLVWLELLRDGMVFDLQGLKPSGEVELPTVDHRFDFDHSRTFAMYEAVRLIPGEHLIAGANTVPVIRCLISLARDLVHEFEDIEAVVWPPSQSVIGRRFFESISTAWLDGGAFPALGLTSFRETVDGGLQSVGLDYLIGQELRIEPSLAAERVEATRLGIRLVNQLILVGGIDESERVTAPDGTRLILRPSRNGNFVRVWSE